MSKTENGWKWLFHVCLAFALAFSMLVPMVGGVEANSEPVHNIHTGENFSTIQGAINAVNTTDGHTITVDSGNYSENVDVYKRLTIRSASGNPADTIVNALDSNDHVFNVTAGCVNITGFTVKGATASGKAGIHLDKAEHCNISDNNATNNTDGIRVGSSSSNSTITNNTCTNNKEGIVLFSSNNTVTNNTADWNEWYGIRLCHSSNNTVTNNTASSNNHYGINLHLSSSNNTLTNNRANLNQCHGIWLSSSSNNTFTNNTASNNTDYDFYSDKDSHGNTIEDLTVASYPTTISFIYDKGVGVKGVNTPPSDPSGKANIGKYVNATNVTADSWISLNVSYTDANLGNVDEDSLRMWKYNGTWTEVPPPNGVNIVEKYVYADITEFSIFAPLGNPSPFPPVGGEAYPVNKLAILAPWIALALAVVAGATILIRRRRAQS